jgi:hypothetical protein
MKRRQPEPSGEVGRVTPFAPFGRSKANCGGDDPASANYNRGFRVVLAFRSAMNGTAKCSGRRWSNRSEGRATPACGAAAENQRPEYERCTDKSTRMENRGWQLAHTKTWRLAPTFWLRQRRMGLPWLALFLTVAVTHAGRYALPWCSTDAGAGASSSARYTVVATVGQPDAGVMHGANQQVAAGFWNRWSANRLPVAPLAVYSRPRGVACKILISTLITNAYDLDLEAVTFGGVSATSTNNATITTDAVRIFYYPPAANPDVTDAFAYQVGDTLGELGSGLVLFNLQPDSTNQTFNIVGIAPLPDGNCRIDFAGISGRTYLVQATTNLSAPQWVTIATNVAGANGLWSFVDLNATNYVERFYRTAQP